MNGLTIGEMLNWASKYLKGFGVDNPRLDAEVLLAHTLGCDRVYLFRESSQVLDDNDVQHYRRLIDRRSAGEPVAYLTGYKEFMGLDFKVGPHVLIPRPETELMVEYAQAVLSGWPGRRVAVDVGTGSGAIAISLARLVPGAEVYAIDISPKALEIARANAKKHGVNVVFHAGDLLTTIKEIILPGSVAVIIANLPYIPSGDISNLAQDVRCYEPVLALDGGPDGLDLYRRLVPQASGFLASGGHLLMEIDPSQSDLALGLVPQPHWQSCVLKDLAGRLRLVCAQLIHAGGF